VAGVQHVRARDGLSGGHSEASPPPLDEVLLADVFDAACVHWVWQECDDDGEASEEEQTSQDKYPPAEDGLQFAMGREENEEEDVEEERV
jgi:hypothetical protein